MADNLILLIVAAFALMGSPGPANLSLAAAGSAFGVARSARYLAGIIMGTIAVLLMIAAGLGSIVLAIPGLPPVLAVLGACYILYLAYKIATAPVVTEAAEPGRAPSAAGGLLLGVSNPKAFAAIGAVYASVTVVPGDPLRDAAAKVAALSVLVVIVSTAWLALGASAQTLLRRPRVARSVNVVLAILLVVSAVLPALR